MPQYKEITHTVNVPLNTGIPGFLRAIESILRLPRVMQLTIDATGRVDFTRQELPEEEPTIGVDFTGLVPSHIIRGAEALELDVVSNLAPVAISHMFVKVTEDGLNPIAFATGANSWLWKWHKVTSNIELNRAEAYGLPVLRDHNLPDETLVLCAGYSRAATLVDTKRVYKITIPGRTT